MSKLKHELMSLYNGQLRQVTLQLLKINFQFCIPYFSATKNITKKCHYNEYSQDKYDMILGRYIITAL